MWLAGKWHLVVISLTNIEKGMELRADFTQIQFHAEESSIESPIHSSTNSSNQSSPLHSDKNPNERTIYPSKLAPSVSNENTIFGQQSQPQAPPTLPTPQQ